MRKQHLILLTVLAQLIVGFAMQVTNLAGEEPESNAPKSSLAERIAVIAAEYEKQQTAFYDELRALGKLSNSLERVEYRKRIGESNNKFNEYQRPAAAALAELLKANASDPAVVDGILLYTGPMSHSIGIVPEWETEFQLAGSGIRNGSCARCSAKLSGSGCNKSRPLAP